MMLHKRERLFFETPMEISQIIIFQERYVYPLCPQCGISLNRWNLRICPACHQLLGWNELQFAQITKL